MDGAGSRGPSFLHYVHEFYCNTNGVLLAHREHARILPLMRAVDLQRLLECWVADK